MLAVDLCCFSLLFVRQQRAHLYARAKRTAKRNKEKRLLSVGRRTEYRIRVLVFAPKTLVPGMDIPSGAARIIWHSLTTSRLLPRQGQFGISPARS